MLYEAAEASLSSGQICQALHPLTAALPWGAGTHVGQPDPAQQKMLWITDPLQMWASYPGRALLTIICFAVSGTSWSAEKKKSMGL